MAYLRVVYNKRDIDFDYIPVNRLEALIAGDEISHFFRPAERRWVSVKFDAVCRGVVEPYAGPERRKVDPPIRVIESAPESRFASEEAPEQDWLAGLWRRIEKF